MRDRILAQIIWAQQFDLNCGALDFFNNGQELPEITLALSKINAGLPATSLENHNYGWNSRFLAKDPIQIENDALQSRYQNQSS